MKSRLLEWVQPELRVAGRVRSSVVASAVAEQKAGGRLDRVGVPLAMPDLTPLLEMTRMRDLRIMTRRQYAPSVKDVKGHLGLAP